MNEHYLCKASSMSKDGLMLLGWKAGLRFYEFFSCCSFYLCLGLPAAFTQPGALPFSRSLYAVAIVNQLAPQTRWNGICGDQIRD